MVLSIDIPEDISNVLGERWGDLSGHVRETLAVQGYSEGLLTKHQVRRLLGLRSRFQVEAFLKTHGATPDYALPDLEADLERLRRAKPARS